LPRPVGPDRCHARVGARVGDTAGARASTMRYAVQQPNRRSNPTGTQRGLRAQLARITAARAAYDILTTIVRGRRPSDAQRARAPGIPREAWERVLDLEGCAAWLETARRRTPALADVLGPALPVI